VTVDTGVLLGDRYRLGDRIAVGGMGEVWRARDELLDREVAVKVLKPEYAQDESFLERFRAEARHTAALTHPGIAGVYDYGEGAGTAYLVMELVPGDPLSALLAREGRLSPDRTLDLVAQVARALDTAHRSGVIHRDVKPGNILVCDDGTVKVTDFGIARAADAVPLTKTGVVLGTAQYLSPEQGNGSGVTPASDVYSLGVVAYECLAGKRPFEADSPVAVAMAHLYEDPPPLPDDVPAEAATLVMTAMAKDPTARYASAADLADAAEAVRTGAPAPTPPVVAPGEAPATLALPVAGAPADATTTVAPAAPAEPSPVVSWWRRQEPQTIAVVLGVALAVLIAVVAVVALRPPPKRTVPALVGKPAKTAYAALDRLGLDHKEKAAYSRRWPKGAVVAVTPKAGTVLRKGDDVSVTVSRGPQPVTLSEGLLGQQVDTVATTLTGQGLTVTRQGMVTDAPFGTVVAVTPAQGLHQGDAVTVTYSLGLPRDGRKKHGKGDGGD
jgi:predicted Ser/Thr protein kinase